MQCSFHFSRLRAETVCFSQLMTSLIKKETIFQITKSVCKHLPRYVEHCNKFNILLFASCHFGTTVTFREIFTFGGGGGGDLMERPQNNITFRSLLFLGDHYFQNSMVVQNACAVM